MPVPNSFFQSVLHSLSGTRAVTMTVNNATEPERAMSPRVLVVVFNPIWDRSTGRQLLQALRASRMTSAEEEQAEQGKQGLGFQKSTPIQVEHHQPPTKLAQH